MSHFAEVLFIFEPVFRADPECEAPLYTVTQGTLWMICWPFHLHLERELVLQTNGISPPWDMHNFFGGVLKIEECETSNLKTRSVILLNSLCHPSSYSILRFRAISRDIVGNWNWWLSYLLSSLLICTYTQDWQLLHSFLRQYPPQIYYRSND